MGQVASGSVPPQGKVCACTTALIINNAKTLKPIFNFILYPNCPNSTELYLYENF